MMISRLILSDVDGTLLDGRATPPPGWERFVASLEPTDLFTLASSRTTTELLAVQASLGVRGPLIAENGSMVVLGMDWPGGLAGRMEQVDGDLVRVVALGSRRLPVLAMMREVAAVCNLEIEYTLDAGLEIGPPDGRGRLVVLDDAATRQRSVLVQVSGTRRQRELLHATLEGSALSMVPGGRWQVVQCGSNKGIAATVLRNMLHAQRCRPQVIAVGDHANDRPMLEMADIRFAVRRPDGSVHPALADIPNLQVPNGRGPDAWNEIATLLGAQEVSHA
jgi:predicted mannosyl-3-phosphoglycerate phosphatase (HAD superfamily)